MEDGQSAKRLPMDTALLCWILSRGHSAICQLFTVDIKEWGSDIPSPSPVLLLLSFFDAFSSACETRLCFSSLSIFVKRLLFFLFLKYDNLVIKVPMHCNPQQEKVNDRACQNYESL